MLIDASFAARPIHDWLLQQGFEVWTIGNRPGDLLAQRDTDFHIVESYHDPAVVQTHLDRLEIDYVVPGCTDVSFATAMQVRVPGTSFDPPETYAKLANKRKFRALCKELDLSAPRMLTLDQLPVPGRVVAKPCDSFSGKGISIIDGGDVEAAAVAVAAAQRESQTSEALLETYIDGQLYSLSCFVEGHKIVDGTFVREDGSVTPFAVDVTHVVRDFPEQGQAILTEELERMTKHLELTDGLLHVQFIWDGARCWLIEVSRRCPGDLYAQLIEMSTGQPYGGRYASYFVDRPVPKSPIEHRHILRHTITAGHDKYEGISFNGPASIAEFHSLTPIGRVPPQFNQIDRVALLFLEYQSAALLNTQRQAFLKRKAYRTSR